MDDIRVGDRVQRERGKQTIGVVERIFTPTYGKRYPVAKVRWLDSFAMFAGGTRDHHSTVAVVSLRKVEDDADLLAADRAYDDTQLGALDGE